MASITPNTLTQKRPQLYMPKLQYRNSSTADVARPNRPDSVRTDSTNSFAATASTRSTFSDISDQCPSPGDAMPLRDAPQPDESQSSKSKPSLRSPQVLADRPKKKGKSFFRYFSVKEPSQQAFEEYQRQMRKKGNTPDSRGAWAGISGVSSTKMPHTVPKVNSKWDGVPQALKDKERAKDEGTRSIGTYRRPISTARSDGSTSTSSSSSFQGSRPRYKLPSQSDNSLADLYGWERAGAVDCCNNNLEPKGLKRNKYFRATSATSLSDASSVSLQGSTFATSLPESYLQVQLPPLPSCVSGEHGKGNEHYVDELPVHCSSPAPTPPEVSPITPDGPFRIMQPGVSKHTQVSCTQVDHFAGNSIKTTTIDVPSSSEIIDKSNRIPVLGPPVSARRKQKCSPFLAGEAKELMTSR